FNLGNQHAEALARMRHILTPEPKHDAGHRRITNLGEGSEFQWDFGLQFEFREAETGSRINHSIVLGACLLPCLARVHAPAIWALTQLSNDRVEPYRISQALSQCLGQHL